MTWNWQKPNWPNFTYKTDELRVLESVFLQKVGEFSDLVSILESEDSDNLTVEILTDEAVNTSKIEAQILDRASVQSSIQNLFGFKNNPRLVKPAENGISELISNLYNTYTESLSHEYLYNWHKLLLSKSNSVEHIGEYRKHLDPMLVVSGQVNNPKIHFEAPPSSEIPNQMNQFLSWYNHCNTENRLNVLVKSGIAHLYFISIHPFEDGNGRIARFISQKSIIQDLGKPIILSISNIINKHKNEYYNQLDKSNKSLEITDWLIYFAKTIIESLEFSNIKIRSIINKNKILRKFGNSLNSRQIKLINKLFEYDYESFEGGLSLSNYLSIVKTSSATASRDLSELVKLGVLAKTGEKRYTRYLLNPQSF